MPLKRTANATWTGDLKTGKGTMGATSGAFKDTPYSFTTRFEDTPGTNPEELVAAALASCYSMALSNNLATAGHKVERVTAKATLTMDKTDAGWTTTNIHLDVEGKVGGVDQGTFDKFAQDTKTTCPVSRLLKTDITVKPTLTQ